MVLWIFMEWIKGDFFKRDWRKTLSWLGFVILFLDIINQKKKKNHSWGNLNCSWGHKYALEPNSKSYLKWFNRSRQMFASIGVNWINGHILYHIIFHNYPMWRTVSSCLSFSYVLTTFFSTTCSFSHQSCGKVITQKKLWHKRL